MHGGRSRVEGREAVAWAREATELGAGEVLLTSMDRDGTTDGYDLELTRAVAEAVSVPVIASGGAGELDHLVEAVRPGTPTRCSAPRSSTTAPTRSPRQGADGAGRDPGRAPSRPFFFPALPSSRAASRPSSAAWMIPLTAGPWPWRQRVDRLVAGQEDLLAVGDHRVVGPVRVLEDLVAVGGVEAVGGGRAAGRRRRRCRRSGSPPPRSSRGRAGSSAPRRCARRARRSCRRRSRSRRWAGCPRSAPRPRRRRRSCSWSGSRRGRRSAGRSCTCGRRCCRRRRGRRRSPPWRRTARSGRSSSPASPSAT